jgi:hypothetical protein
MKRNTSTGFIVIKRAGTKPALFITMSDRNYKCDCIFLSKTDLGTAPICLSTTLPPFTKRIAGIDVIP